MPLQKQIENPQGAFGYVTTGSTPTPGEMHSQRVTRVRNLSTSNPIRIGDAVVWAASTVAGWGSTAGGVLTPTTVDEGVFRTTVPAHPGFAGIAIGPPIAGSSINVAAVRTTASTLGVPGPSSEYCNIVTWGPVWANLTTGAGNAPGDVVTLSNSTVTTAAGSSGGGLLEPATTGVLTSAAGFQRMVSILGFLFTSGTTGTTGFLSPAIARGLLWLAPSVSFNSGASTA